MRRHTESAPPPPPPPPERSPHVRWHPTVRSPRPTPRYYRGLPPRRRLMPRAPPRSWWRATRFVVACVATYTLCTLLRDGPPSRVASVVVVGAMGSGTVHTSRELRALGLDVTHERFDGRDGAVGYAHALLYLDPLDDKERDPLCLTNLKRAWHPQLIFVDARGECGEERDHRGASPGGAMKRVAQCWRKACPAAARRWRGCGAKGTCPIELAPKPVVLVRHPLRTVESLVAGFCGDGALAANGTRSVEPQILAMARIVGLEEAPLAQISCAHGFARAWAAYYGALELLIKKGAAAGVVRVEQDDGVCAIVSKAAAAAKPPQRLAAAAETCAHRGWRAWLPALRERWERIFDVGPFDDGANRRNEGRLRLSWRDLRRVDKPLAAEMLRLAEFYGYDKPRAGDRLRPDS